MDQTRRMKELVQLLNQASKAYYQDRQGDHEQPGV